MPHEVIMPALGMSQDTGTLMSWHKAVGDRVGAGDILFEVETDKATMEIEAGVDGYLAELRLAEGDEAPVGSVIAVIADSRPDESSGADDSGEAEEPTTGSGDEAGAKAGSETTAAETEDWPSPDAARSPDGLGSAPALPPTFASRADPARRVLASPKARRIASESGVSLDDMRAAGVAEPFHARDVENFDPGASAAPGPRGAAMLELAAVADGAAFSRFVDWAGTEAGVSAGRVWIAFAAGALRAAGTTGPVTVSYAAGGRSGSALTDADLRPLSDDIEDATASPALAIHDWTGTRLSRAAIGGGCTLSVFGRGAGLELALATDPGMMDVAAAARFLDGLAARIEDPLRQLL
jgi:pyruvate/2-oxoglutarate dehydrogenase complex dihydrolipoamide acyltransferase (E2) component